MNKMNEIDPAPSHAELDLDPSGSHTLEALHVLGEISSTLADEDDLDELLGRFLGTMIRLAKADAGVVRVLTSDGQHLRMVASRGLPPEVVEKERLVSRDCGQCGVAIGLNRPLFEIDLKGCDERTGGNFFKTGCQAMVVVPLSNAGRLLGTYNLYLPEAFELPEEVALLFRSIGEHLGMALENARLKRENLRIVLTSERQMMAAEIHDSLAQTLAYMKMRMAMLNDAIADQSLERTAKYAGDVGQALDEAYGHLRELLVQFRSRMDPMGLQHALQGLACGFQERTGIMLRYDNRLTDLRLAPEQESQVFHILQEALANVARHSGATEASLTLEASGDYYNATIEDNGKGGQGFFAIANRVGGFQEHPGLRDHFGLAIMRERAQKIGGHLEVANLPRGGFRVRLSFPPGGGVTG
ncbi:MAG: GAF sensor signal transduction histidine kinase [Rhodocyclaceae bacterium]|jgi:two-component system nitrate/nitrite sensor histidine kinase NarX|nr:MAG: GAF sensor signal transduction histidine kinase [Rhodocyclaceae bacterium]TND01721.1 MAG: GAF sensor signal transduction histidine kinase [Rhodocyclaceae bacterium]